MMRKPMWSAVVIAILLFGNAMVGSAQESTASSKPRSAYRLDFSLHELEDGKNVNTRQYSMNLVPDSSPGFQDLKIGTRIPVELKQGEMQYIDVGTNISARLVEVRDALQVEVRADLSNLAAPDQQRPAAMPLLRQLRINGTTIVTPGKAMVIGAVDDPNSKRQYQLEITVTKLR
jgi:hypothetical protein